MIIYHNWGFNSDTVIVKGTPSYHFLDIAKRVVGNGKKQGLELKMPWAAHITATRFSEEMSPEELQGFFKLMQEAPQVLSGNQIKRLDVGYITLDKDEFKFNTVEQFKLI